VYTNCPIGEHTVSHLNPEDAIEQKLSGQTIYLYTFNYLSCIVDEWDRK